MKSPLRLAFSDFYHSFDVNHNVFTSLLRKRYEVELVDRHADLTICSVYGKSSVRCTGRKVLVIMENFRPDLDAFDAVISFDSVDDPRHFHLPLSMFGNEIQRPADWSAEEELSRKSRFCNFIFSNPSCVPRNRLLQRLQRYKRVDCGGRCFNNVGGRVPNKYEFQRSCKFSIAFENSSQPGYLTEKLSDAFRADTIPLYWGDPLASKFFNADAFLHQDNYRDVDALVERVIELDQNDELYLEMLRQPAYVGGQMPSQFRPENVLRFFVDTIQSDRPPVATLPNYSRIASAYVSRLEMDVWRRRMNRWRHRTVQVLFGRLAA